MEPLDLNAMPGGPLGAIAGAATAIVSGFLVLRQFLSRGAADRADDAGRVSAINVYKELLDAERAARVLERQRADEFAQQRNEAIKSLGELQGQIKAMAQQLEEQTRELTRLRDQVHTLEEQINAKA